MKRIILKSIFILLSFLVSIDSFAETTPLDSLFKYLYQNKLFNGVVFITNNNEVVYKRAFGYSNREWQIPNTIDTKFEIGSISKQFTATVVRQFAAEGYFRLSDKISKFLPELSSNLTTNVTIQQLLNHTSGIPNYVRFPNFISLISKVFSSKSDYINELNQQNLLFPSGTAFHYSNTGYMLLGIIIEKVTSKSLIQNFKERIFNPLGMKNTGAFDDEKIITKRAYGYEKDYNNKFIIPRYMKKSEATLAETGLYSTVDDLNKWYNALQSGTIMSEDNIKNGFAFSENSGYLDGNFYMLNENPSLTIFHHEGSVPGSTSLFMRVVETNQCIILLNNNGMAQENILLNIANIIREYLNGKSLQTPTFDAYNALIYSAVFNDISIVEKQFLYIKNNYSHIYNFDSRQLENLYSVLLSVFDLRQKAEQITQLNKKLFPEN